MRWLSNLLITAGLLMVAWFGYSLYEQQQMHSVTLAQAEQAVQTIREETEAHEETDRQQLIDQFKAEQHEAVGILRVPKIDRSIGIVEGTDPDALDLGVGHMSSTAFPGQGEQIVLSGHRDTVFRNFAELEIGDKFIVEMPYGTFTYEIRETEIVDADDTSVVRPMGEEVLVVSTCYPFNYVGSAPERFVFYAYPVE